MAQRRVPTCVTGESGMYTGEGELVAVVLDKKVGLWMMTEQGRGHRRSLPKLATTSPEYHNLPNNGDIAQQVQEFAMTHEPCLPARVAPRSAAHTCALSRVIPLSSSLYAWLTYGIVCMAFFQSHIY